MSTAQALKYAEMGYGAFLVQPHGKAPATRNGLKDATTDPVLISRWPEGYNLGILPPKRVLVLDADTPDEADRLEREHPELARRLEGIPRAGARTSFWRYQRAWRLLRRAPKCKGAR